MMRGRNDEEEMEEGDMGGGRGDLDGVGKGILG